VKCEGEIAMTTNFTNRVPASLSSDDGFVGYMTGAVIALAGVLLVAVQFALV
jgi:hypothetical protein